MVHSQIAAVRLPDELGDEISRLAERLGITMLDVVTPAVHQLWREEWWSSVRGAFDGLSDADAASYRTKNRLLDSATADGLGER